MRQVFCCISYEIDFAIVKLLKRAEKASICALYVVDVAFHLHLLDRHIAVGANDYIEHLKVGGGGARSSRSPTRTSV